jgi:hypothetical protein
MNDSLIVSESMAAEGVSGERYAKKILQVAVLTVQVNCRFTHLFSLYIRGL